MNGDILFRHAWLRILDFQHAGNTRKGKRMTSQKIENLLNLALDATETERLRSVNLQVGVGDAAFEKFCYCADTGGKY